MKRMFTQKSPIFKLTVAAALITGSLLSVQSSYGQSGVYYSQFPDSDTAGKYSSVNPSGCNTVVPPPPIQNLEGIIDEDYDTYALIKASSITQRYDCGTSYYKFFVDLNLLGDSSYLGAGNQAGFAIKLPNGFNTDSLGTFLKVSSYLRDPVSNVATFQEYAVGGGSSGLQLKFLTQAQRLVVYLDATKPFNLLELDVNPKVIPTNSNFEMRVYYGTGGRITGVFPAQIANFKAAVSGKNVNLSWQSLTETNVKSYRIERSNGNGLYTTVANVAAKGNSNTTLSYAFTDKAGVDGNYLYRIIVVNNDGTTKATNSLPAAIVGQGKLILYPTIVKAGQDVTVKTSVNGVVNIYLFDATGRMVKQQRTTSSGQFTIPTTGLSNGVYNVKVVSANGDILQSKIVVN